jgi:hypothetical protein
MTLPSITNKSGFSLFCLSLPSLPLFKSSEEPLSSNCNSLSSTRRVSIIDFLRAVSSCGLESGISVFSLIDSVMKKAMTFLASEERISAATIAYLLYRGPSCGVFGGTCPVANLRVCKSTSSVKLVRLLLVGVPLVGFELRNYVLLELE